MIKADKIQIERLKILCDVVFPVILAKDTEQVLNHYAFPCGAPMCIAGHACVLPEFIKQGLILKEPHIGVQYCPRFEGLNADEALDGFFGEGAYDMLFASDITELEDEEFTDRDEITKRYEFLKEFLTEKTTK